MVETTILYMSTRQNPAQVLHEASAAYKVDTNAIAVKVKQEFAVEEKLKKAAQPSAKATKKAARRTGYRGTANRRPSCFSPARKRQGDPR